MSKLHFKMDETMKELDKVAPLTGAWIETREKHQGPMTEEMRELNKDIELESNCRALHGRVD